MSTEGLAAVRKIESPPILLPYMCQSNKLYRAQGKQIHTHMLLVGEAIARYGGSKVAESADATTV